LGYTLVTPDTVDGVRGALSQKELLKDLIKDDDELLDHVEAQGFFFQDDLYRGRIHKDEPVRVRLPWGHVKKREVPEPAWFGKLLAYERPIVPFPAMADRRPGAPPLEDEEEWTEGESDDEAPEIVGSAREEWTAAEAVLLDCAQLGEEGGITASPPSPGPTPLVEPLLFAPRQLGAVQELGKHRDRDPALVFFSDGSVDPRARGGPKGGYASVVSVPLPGWGVTDGNPGVFSRGQPVSVYGAEEVAIDLMEIMAVVNILEFAPDEDLVIYVDASYVLFTAQKNS
jgi:hypothetical protein